MNILGLLFGLAVLVALFVIWIRAYKSIKGEAGGMDFKPVGRARGKNVESLEEFVAAYRRGEVQAPSGATPLSAAAEKMTPDKAGGEAQLRSAFLTPEVKLVYHVCRVGLRDHHTFANVRLAALCTPGPIAPSLSNAGVDLLVCNAELTPVAALDVIGPQAGEPDSGKTEFLRTIGLRYLRLSAKSPPAPEALKAMLYRM
ncbi:MAG: hypothetical protein ACKVP2_17685 [Burkholderiales bacterium]